MGSSTWSTALTTSAPRYRSMGLKSLIAFPKFFSPPTVLRYAPVCCTNLTPWEPSPVTYARTNEDGGKFLKGTTIFETLRSEDENEIPTTSTEEFAGISDRPSMKLQFLKWIMWFLGPCLLLTTGMVPTLWLPLSSIFLGPNIASLLALTGLDCIFNLGSMLFLLMAHSSAQAENPLEDGTSKAPFGYRFWNVVATVVGLCVPLAMLLGSHKGFFQPQLPSIAFAILLGPYLLLLSVQILTESLTWHWRSPVWLVTPVVYEAYRVLQLLRGLKLGAELSAPAWVLHAIKVLVCWWVLIISVQLMRVAWFAGSAASARRSKLPANGL